MNIYIYRGLKQSNSSKIQRYSLKTRHLGRRFAAYLSSELALDWILIQTHIPGVTLIILVAHDKDEEEQDQNDGATSDGDDHYRLLLIPMIWGFQDHLWRFGGGGTGGY